MRFDRAFATVASCSPSRSVILTGRQAHATGQYGLQHSYHHFIGFDSVRSLPVLLSEAGYRTARAGKLHVAPEEAFRFDERIGGSARNPVQMAANAAAFVGAEDERPFFLYFCTSDPHRGGGLVEDAPHRPDAFGNRPRGYAGVEPVPFDPAAVPVPPYLPDTPVCRAELAQYYQSVARVDQGLGRLLAVLEEAGVLEQTAVLVTSDHGIAFPGAKTGVYDAGLHVPLVVRLPGANEPGRASDALVSLADLTPTVLELAGATPEDADFHGRSFAAVLRGGELSGPAEVYASHTFHEVTMSYPMRMIRTPRHKLIWNLSHQLPFPFARDLWNSPTWQDVRGRGPDTPYGLRTVHSLLHRPEFELFDLEADPGEVNNLAGAPEHAELLAELQGRLRAFQERTGDPWRLQWERR